MVMAVGVPLSSPCEGVVIADPYEKDIGIEGDGFIHLAFVVSGGETEDQSVMMSTSVVGSRVGRVVDEVVELLSGTARSVGC